MTTLVQSLADSLARESYADSLPLQIVHRIEDSRVAAMAADAVERVAGPLLPMGESRWVLRGAPLGHAAHPLLTDLPLGCWTSASILDLVGGERARPAATTLVGVGLLSALPTAFTGLLDFTSLVEKDRRVAVVHAAGNTAALGLYAASWRARRKERHRLGAALALTGATVAAGAGFLGGHLAIGRGTGSRLPEGTAPGA